MVDERVAVALQTEHRFVTAYFLFGGGFFKVPFEQSGNFTYCFAAAGSVHKFKIVVAPTCLHVKQNSRRCSTVALCRVEETSRRVAQCVCAVGGVAVTGTSVFLDDVCRCLRNFVKVFASTGGVELRFRGAKMVRIAARA